MGVTGIHFAVGRTSEQAVALHSDTSVFMVILDNWMSEFLFMAVQNVSFFTLFLASRSRRDTVIRVIDVCLIKSWERTLTTCEGEKRDKISFRIEFESCALINSLQLLRDASKMKLAGVIGIACADVGDVVQVSGIVGRYLLLLK